jgi:hypothetical protein
MSIGTTSRCPTRIAASSPLGLRPKRNRRVHRRGPTRVGVDWSPVVPRQRHSMPTSRNGLIIWDTHLFTLEEINHGHC